MTPEQHLAPIIGRYVMELAKLRAIIDKQAEELAALKAAKES